MAHYLLDATAIGFLMVGDPRVRARLEALESTDVVCTSTVVLAELFRTIDRHPRNRTRVKIIRRHNLVFAWMPILPITAAAARSYATFTQAAAKTAVRLESNDLWLAATAHTAQCVLVTANQEFRRLKNLKVEDWTSS